MGFIGGGFTLLGRGGWKIIQRGLGDGGFWVKVRGLGQIGHGQPALAGNLAPVRLLRACQQPQQGGLPRAVAAHNADFIPLGNGEGDMLQQMLFAVMQG